MQGGVFSYHIVTHANNNIITNLVQFSHLEHSIPTQAPPTGGMLQAA